MTSEVKPTAGAVRAAEKIAWSVADGMNMPTPRDWVPSIAAIIDRETGAADMLEALRGCDSAFADWQIGMVPGRSRDILALITKVRAAIAKAQPEHKPRAESGV